MAKKAGRSPVRKAVKAKAPKVKKSPAKRAQPKVAKKAAKPKVAKRAAKPKAAKAANKTKRVAKKK